MTIPFTFDLTINLPDGGRLTKQLVNLYFDNLADDINQTAYQLCQANATIQAQKFAGLTLKRADGWTSSDGSLKVYALFSVSAEESTFINEVIARYMDGFSDSIKKASGSLFSRSGPQPETSTTPTDWEVEVHPVEPPAK